MIKKISIISVFLLTLFLLPSRVLAAGATLYFSPSSQTVGNDCAVPVDIMLDTGGENSSGADIIIYYDQVKLSVDSLQEGVLYSNYLTIEDVPDQGKIVIQAVNNAGEYFLTTAGNAEKYATINFKTIALGSANVEFKFNGVGDTSDTNITGEGGTDLIDSSLTDGTITIEDGVACPGADNPTSTPTPSDDDDNGVGSDDLTTPTPTTYTAPVSGSTANTIAIALTGAIFLLTSVAFTWLKK